MNRLGSLLLVVIAALTVTGCASIYTHINKIDDANYYITRVKGAQSTLFLCAPIADTAALRCVEVATTNP